MKNTTMNISLPEELRRRIENAQRYEESETGYELSRSAFICRLLKEALEGRKF